MHLTQVLQRRGLKILQWLEEVFSYYCCVENFGFPKVLRNPGGNGLEMLLSGPEGAYTFLFHLPSQFHSLPHRSPSQCPLRYTCPSLGEERSWRWHSWDRLQLWKDRQKSVMNWLKIFSPATSQLPSPQWYFSPSKQAYSLLNTSSSEHVNMLLCHECDLGQALSLTQQQNEHIPKRLLTVSIVAYFPAFVMCAVICLEDNVKNIAPGFDFRRTWEFAATIGTKMLFSRDNLEKYGTRINEKCQMYWESN